MYNEQPIVLMYHGLMSQASSLPSEREVGAELYDVSVRNFKDQMNLLKDRGYQVSTSTKSSSNIILTFDDGEMSNFTEARPILKALGFTAYFFVIAQRVGKKGYMGWDEIRTLYREGMIIGSHGFSHEILTNLVDSQVEEELRASKNYLERNLNINVETLSIPRGFCNDKIIHMAYEIGYKTVFISDRPNDLSEKCFSRMAIKRHWTINKFENAILGKTTTGDRLVGLIKRLAKAIFKESGYNRLRSLVLRVFK